MCGIVAAVAERNVVPILIEGLRRLEYRGYDSAGIAHTRWATHGVPSERNAHPHASGGVSVVHNGIIENHDAIRARARQPGFRRGPRRACGAAARCAGDPFSLQLLAYHAALLRGNDVDKPRNLAKSVTVE